MLEKTSYKYMFDKENIMKTVLTSDLAKLYAKRTADMVAKVKNSDVYVDIQLRKISASKLDAMRETVRMTVGSDRVWNEFSFRTGRLLGMFRQMSNNMKHMPEFEKLGITTDDINDYRIYYGSTPYRNKTTGEIVQGILPSSYDKLKDWITCMYLKLGLYLDETDLNDINKAVFKEVHKRAYQYAIDTDNLEKGITEQAAIASYEE